MVVLTTVMIITVTMLPDPVTAGIGTWEGSSGKEGDKHYTYVQNSHLTKAPF